MHKVFNYTRCALQRQAPKHPHKPSSQRLGARSLPCNEFTPGHYTVSHYSFVEDKTIGEVITRYTTTCTRCGVVAKQHGYNK